MANDRNRTNDETRNPGYRSPDDDLIRGVGDEVEDDFEDSEDIDEEEEEENDASF